MKIIQKAKSFVRLPPKKHGIIVLGVLAGYLLITSCFMPLRAEHWLVAVTFGVLFFLHDSTRKLAMAMIPWALFGASYDWMNLYPNYKAHSVDIERLYKAEKRLFGVTSKGQRFTLNEYFAEHNCRFLDCIAGISYLCWVPVPIAHGLWLYFSRKRQDYLRFACSFLFTNLIGFMIYYIHPAAPPWYVAEYGFDFNAHTPGNVAGLERFDRLVKLKIFASLYTRTSNVFAALPSLHASYLPVTFYSSMRAKCMIPARILFAMLSFGIWFAAIYTSHHYVIDVLSGIACALVGVTVFDQILLRIPPFARFMKGYTSYISADDSRSLSLLL